MGQDSPQCNWGSIVKQGTATDLPYRSAAKRNQPVNGAWRMTILLMLTSTLAYVDRQMFVLFSEQIKHDLDLTDTEIGMLQGIAFSFFYGVLSFPIARLADAHSRRTIIRLSVLFWSAMTAMTAFSKSFASIFLFRAGTASGEAGLAPSASAMIADAFPRSKMPLPMSLYTLSIYIGSGIAFTLGAVVQTTMGQNANVVFPVLGEAATWQIAYAVAGLLGLPWAVIALRWLKDPTRSDYSASGAVVDSTASRATFGDLFRFLHANRGFLIPFFAGCTLILAAVSVIFSWTPVVLIRSFEESVSRAGFIFAALFISCGIGGAVIAGLIANSKLVAGKKDGLTWLVLVAVCGLLVSQLFSLGGESASSYTLLSACSIFFVAPCISLPPAILQGVATSNMRAQLAALFLLTTGVLGIGVGPIIVGVVSDYVFAEPMQLHLAVASSVIVLCGIAIPLLLLCRLTSHPFGTPQAT